MTERKRRGIHCVGRASSPSLTGRMPVPHLIHCAFPLRVAVPAMLTVLLLVSLTGEVLAQQPHFWLQTDGTSSQLGSVSNPSVVVREGKTNTLYLWMQRGTASNGFDGISFDVRLISSNSGLAAVSVVWDEPPGRWFDTSPGGPRTDSGGTGIDDANLIDLSNTDTIGTNPIRMGTLTFTGTRAGTVSVWLCVGKYTIADGGTCPSIWLGFANGQISAEQFYVGGGVAGLCSNVAEATVNVTPNIGDFDFDGDVDLVDFGTMQRCLSGSTVPQNDPTCADAKFDDDVDVDNADMQRFLNCLSGHNIPANPSCAQ